MPGGIVTVASTIMCPHGGTVTDIPTSTRVLVAGTPPILLTDQGLVAGCPFNTGSPSPCIKVQWMVGATRVLIEGRPPLVQSSTGLCIGPAPQGPPVIVAVQPRVIAQ
ncbi:MAG: hypothetical protein JST12_19395 [Armatimonadetes bacterium]|nr:hypothetical protein [Armatimonadota bacterium]MBS1703838.1 hypothetical protein [Armatimonadota bacterium]MBS1726210.1 hypothetical protein [Armatimonadota bacterium]